MYKLVSRKIGALFVAALCFMCVAAFEPADIVIEDCSKQAGFAADCSGFRADGAGEAKNVILIIGDGMGINQVFAGRVSQRGPGSPYRWEELPNKGLVKTCSVGDITDSAASATAMATGHKTDNRTVSMTAGGDKERIPNIGDLFRQDKAIGIVSTTKIWDATPAAFVSHAEARDQDREIARQMIGETRPEVILGGGADAFSPGIYNPRKKDGRPDYIEAAKKSGYKTVFTRDELLALDAKNEKRVLGLFSAGSMNYEIERNGDNLEPHLSEMTRVALESLGNDPGGFFLMVEGARIDHGAHSASIERVIGEMAELDRTINLVLDWAEKRPDTLVLITADHETGGMALKPGQDLAKGDKIEVEWAAADWPWHAGHSGQRVPIYAAGPNAGAVKGMMDNTEIFCVIKNAFGAREDAAAGTGEKGAK